MVLWARWGHHKSPRRVSVQKRWFIINSTKDTVALDIGNGGATVTSQLGFRIANSLKTFYAVDSSYPTLTRSEFVGDQVLGDAKKIPFSDKSVDYVIFNNTLHHFGLHKDADPSNEIKAFFDEAFRVFRKGVFGVEMVIPHVAQCVETLVLKYMKFMPTFVCSKHFFERLIADIGAEVVDFEAIC